jgi:hypothetical protein
MKKRAILGYTAAGATVLAALLTPFLLLGPFTRMFAGLGLRVDEMYSGGPKLRTVGTAGYVIDIHRPVSPHMLQRENPFVQLDWKPVSALPARVSDTVDVDGDGAADVRVTFDVPRGATAPLRANVEALNTNYEGIGNLGREKLSRLIVRVDDAILVRVPLVKR